MLSAMRLRMLVRAHPVAAGGRRLHCRRLTVGSAQMFLFGPAGRWQCLDASRHALRQMLCAGDTFDHTDTFGNRRTRGELLRAG